MNLDIWNLFALALCLIFSFLFSGMEAGVFALNRLRVRRLARAGNPSAKLLQGFLENPERFLWTILVGNTLANFLILGFTLAKLHEWFLGNRLVILSLFAVAVFLFYAFFDLLPKMLFRAHPNQMCLSAARIFRFVHWALMLVVLPLEDVSRALLRWTGGTAFTGQLFGNREEMRAVMQEAAQALTGEEHAMVNRVLDLQNFNVGQIATPLVKAVTFETQMPLRTALKVARERGLSRFPVFETRDGRRRVAGLLVIGPLLYREDLDLDKPVSAHMTPAVFVNENVKLDVAFRLLQRVGQRLAIVLGRDRAEIGVVSLEDILKVMFGEMKL